MSRPTKNASCPWPASLSRSATTRTQKPLRENWKPTRKDICSSGTWRRASIQAFSSPATWRTASTSRRSPPPVPDARLRWKRRNIWARSVAKELPIADCQLSIQTMTPLELKARTKAFAVRIIRLVDGLPANVKGRAIANQIVRSATSVAANYRAACRARSRAEFIAKIGVVEEEADETAFWLELIIDSALLTETRTRPLPSEAGELVAIMAASRKSAFGNRKLAIQ